ncbi:hypothetical protein EV182_002902, partial [Spiromyces aspiralis]
SYPMLDPNKQPTVTLPTNARKEAPPSHGLNHPSDSARSIESPTHTDSLDLNMLGQPAWPIPKFLLAFAGLALTMFLVCTAETVSNQQLSDIASQMNTNIYSPWAASAFLLPCVMIQPVYIKLAEAFGRQWPLIAATLVFSVFSIMCGASTSFLAFVLGRGFQGVGGAGMMPLVLVVLTDIATIRVRGFWLGIMGAVMIAAKWLGPVIGAACLEHASWRWAYYYSAIGGLVAMAILFLTLRDLPRPPSALPRKARHFDYLGIILWLGGSVMILLALAYGGNEFPWRSVTIVSLFVAGFLVICIFGFVEYRFSQWPIIPLRLLTQPRVFISIVASGFIGMAMYTILFFVPVFYHAVRDMSNTAAAAQGLWTVLGGGFFAVVSGIAVRWTYNYRPFILAGTALMAIGYGLMYTWTVQQNNAKEIDFQIIVGAGLGLCMQQVLLAGQAGLSLDEVATVTTLIDYSRTLGSMIGLVISEVVLKDQVIKKLTTILSQFSFIPVVDLHYIDLVSLQTMLPALRKFSDSISIPVFNALKDAINLTYAINVAFAGIAFVLCLFLRTKNLLPDKCVKAGSSNSP